MNYFEDSENPMLQKTSHKDELSSEIKNYVAKHIFPVLKPLREELEQELSETEKNEVDAIRLIFIGLRQIRADAGINSFEIMEAKEHYTREQVEL